MKIQLGLILAITALLPALPTLQAEAGADSDRIIGGTQVNAGDPVAASTVLVVGKEGKEEFICSGSIIDTNIVLTAAHCLGDTGKAQILVVFRTDITGQGPVIPAAAQTRPADFLTKAQAGDKDWDDLALIKLAQPIPQGYSIAKLLPDPSLVKSGASIELAGYGIDVAVAPTDPNDDGGAGVLREVSQSVVDAGFSSTEVLVSLANNRGACHGDSGGPAFVQQGSNLYLFGVASRLTNDDQVANNGNQQDFSCTVNMVYTNILAQMAWVNSAKAQLQAGDTNSKSEGLVSRLLHSL